MAKIQEVLKNIKFFNPLQAQSNVEKNLSTEGMRQLTDEELELVSGGIQYLAE